MTSVLPSPYLLVAFFTVAAVYASVGFAGGSSYLALLVLAGLPLPTLAPTSLACNIAVSMISALMFFRHGRAHARTVLPFLLSSVPMAYAGGSIPIGRDVFLSLLGLALLAAALRLVLTDAPWRARRTARSFPPRPWFVGLPVGAGLGLLSGLTGIGGGIFLAPVLYLLGWLPPKAVASVCGLFIFFNSVAGMAGQATKTGFALDAWLALPLMTAASAGGLIGAGLGSFRLPAIWVRRATAVLIFVAALRTLAKTWF